MPTSKPSGYTLVEVLTVIAVMAILGLTATTLLLGQRTFLTREAYSAGNLADTARAAETIGELSKSASAVVASRDFTVNGATQTYTSDATTLILDLPGYNASEVPLITVHDFVLITPDPANPERLLVVTEADAASARPDGVRTVHGHLTAFSVLYGSSPASASSAVTLALRGRTDLTTLDAQEATAEVTVRLRNH